MYGEEISYQHLVHGEKEIDEIKWTITVKDGVPIAREKHTENFRPGADLAKAQPSTVALAAALWTPELVKAWDEKFVAEVEASRAARAAELAEKDAHLAALQAREAETVAAAQRLAALQAAYAAAGESLAIARQAFRATAQDMGAAEEDAYREGAFTLTGGVSAVRPR